MSDAAEIGGIALLTLKVGACALAAMLVPGVWIGHRLTRMGPAARAVARTLLSLPMVLPPVAVGLLLLMLLSRRGVIGAAAERWLGTSFVLTWQGAAIASAVMAFPLLALGAEQAFAAVPRRLEQVAASLGASRRRVFFAIRLPLASRGILHAVAFAFARGLGEFGATALVAGRMPGRTETLALAIYDRVERFEDAEAFALCAVSVALALAVTGCAEAAWRRKAP